MIKKFFSFCLSPSYLAEEKILTGKKVKNTLLLTLFGGSISLVFLLLYFSGTQFFGGDLPSSSSFIFEMAQIPEDNIEEIVFTFLFFLFFSVVVAPLLEEFAFRLPLRTGKWQTVWGGTLIIFAVLLAFSYLVKDLIWWSLPLMFLLITSLTYPFFGKRWEKFQVGHYGAYCWTLALLFSFLHLGKTLISHPFSVLSLVLTLAYLPAALALSFIRLKYGMRYNILAHAFFNFLPYLIFIIAAGVLGILEITS